METFDACRVLRRSWESRAPQYWYNAADRPTDRRVFLYDEYAERTERRKAIDRIATVKVTHRSQILIQLFGDVVDAFLAVNIQLSYFAGTIVKC